MDAETKEKMADGFESALARFNSVMVLIGDHPGLIIPNSCRSAERAIVLEYGLDMPKPIPDLVVTVDGIYATLSFSQEPHETFVPWEAVRQIEGVSERPRQRAKLRCV
jgi:hypothetical protein